MKYNFSEIKLFDIEGNEVNDAYFHKIIGNNIYLQAKDLDLVEKARSIFKGEEIELDKVEIAEVKELICGEKSNILAFAKKAFQDYVDSKK